MFAARRALADEEEKKDVFGAVADLMVGVVFIFIVMVMALSLVLMDDAVPRPAYDQVVKTLAETQAERDRLKVQADQLVDLVKFLKYQDVAPLLSRLAEADATRSTILLTLKQRLAEKGIEVEADLQNGTLRLPSGNLFNTAQADPTPFGEQVIHGLGVTLAETIVCYLPAPTPPRECRAKKDGSVLSAIYVEGHTDAAPFRNVHDRFRNNWDLSAARAIEAYRIIRESDARIPDMKNAEGKSLVGVSGYADTRPVTEGLSDKQRSEKSAMEADRRIEIRLVMAVNREAVEKTLRELNRKLEGLDAPKP